VFWEATHAEPGGGADIADAHMDDAILQMSKPHGDAYMETQK
jgi:hypothetical protein